MKTNFLILFIFLGIGMFAQNSDFKYSKSINQFGFDLYEKVANENKNILFSPFSISSALTMTYCGAKVQTKKVMAEVLYLPDSLDVVLDSYSEFSRSLQSSFITENITLHSANSLWGEKSYPFNKEYIKMVDTKFNAPFKLVSYINETQKCKEEINKWVEEKTESKIKNLIPDGVLSGNTRLVLTNAIYFYGGWIKAFNKESTHEAPFYLSETDSTQVDFMYSKTQLPYFENELFKAVEIPYKGKAASLYLFIPKNISGFNNLEKTLDYKTFSKWDNQMKESMVELNVPKFDFESEFEMSEVLSAMGMKIAFTNNANFTQMSTRDDLKIDKVIHKAKIGIDEEGTEAAAATAVIMVRKSSVSKEFDNVEFKADRPFMFVLMENQNKSILFMGKVVKP